MTEAKKAFDRLKLRTPYNLLLDELRALGVNRPWDKFEVITKFKVEAISRDDGMLIVMVPNGFFFISSIGKFEFIAKDDIERCYFLMNEVIG